MARSQVQLTIIDAGGELTTSTFPGEEVVTNADMTSFDILTDALQTAVEDIEIGNIARVRKSPYRNVDNGVVRASDPYAQREDKWLVAFQDNITNDMYTLTIPCPDLNGSWFDEATESLDITSPEGQAFTIAFEAVVRAPKTQNPVNVESVLYVGRNI